MGDAGGNSVGANGNAFRMCMALIFVVKKKEEELLLVAR